MLAFDSQYYDLINAFLNCCGATAITLSVIKVYRDKDVKGIDWKTILFFMSWSLWNLILYSHFALWYSLGAGFLMVLAEFSYFYLLLRYGIFKKRAESRGK